MENEETTTPDAVGSAPPMSREILLNAHFLAAKQTARVEIRRITMAPGLVAGYHLHNCPVVGSILTGSVVCQIQGEAESVLGPGDVFYEPEGVPIARFDATDEGVTFLAYFLLDDGQEPEISTEPVS